MLSSGSGGQPRGVRGLVQADYGPESGTSGLRIRRAPWLALLLAGCSSFPASMNPVSWWHDLQGGKIAEERPPPPGADQPYPNLASVPPKPQAPPRGRRPANTASRRRPVVASVAAEPEDGVDPAVFTDTGEAAPRSATASAGRSRTGTGNPPGRGRGGGGGGPRRG